MARSIIKVNVREDGRIEHTLRQFELDMRMKMLKKATRKSAQVFRAQAQRNARAIEMEDRPSRKDFDTEPTGELSRGIKRTGLIQGTRVIGRTMTTGLSAAYAAMLEYGHEMWVFGKQIAGREVQQYPFWRPAKDTTKDKILGTMVATLKEQLKKHKSR